MKKVGVMVSILLIILVFSVVPVLATSDESKEIQQMLICPSTVDLGITVYNNPDSTADAIRQQIDQKLAAGESKDQIINDFVAQYGPSILAVPRKSGVGLGAWIVPPLFIGIGVGAVLLIIRRNKQGQKTQTAKPIKPQEIDSQLEQEIIKHI